MGKLDTEQRSLQKADRGDSAPVAQVSPVRGAATDPFDLSAAQAQQSVAQRQEAAPSRQTHYMSHMTASPQRTRQLPGGTKDHVRFSNGGSVTHDIPDPPKINICETPKKAPIQRQHPFESHISRFALFPTFSSPDDPDTGVRSTARSSRNPQDVIVLSKTKGAPYRHEVHVVGGENALTWPGQQGFYRSPETTSEVLYPTPPKAVCPNPSLRPWSSTLCERTACMLRNLERSRWVTSHRLDFTGSGPMNPIKLDDFHERTIAVAAGASPYMVQLREKSHPQFIPAKPMNGYKQRIREGHHFLQHRRLPTVQHDGHIDQASSSPEAFVSAAGMTDEGSQNDTHKRTPVIPGLATEHPWSDAELREGRRITCTSFNGHPWLPPISYHRELGAPLSRSQSILLVLQDSFSKTEAHRCYQQGLRGSPADLRDNIRTGKRHRFYGFNSYYFHD